MLFLCKAGGFLSLRDMGFPILRSLLTSYTSSEMYGEYYGESMTAIIFSFFVGSVLTISSAIEAFFFKRDLQFCSMKYIVLKLLLMVTILMLV